MDHRTRAAFDNIQQLFQQIQPVLQRYPDVLSVGVGYREGAHGRGEPCIVVGVREGSEHAARVPRQLHGIPIDVQMVPQARLLSSLAPGAIIGVESRIERGQLGLLGRANGKRCALTALHVLSRERLGLLVRGNNELEGRKVMASRLGDAQEVSVGTLRDGVFATDEDIALVELDDQVPVSTLVAGTDVSLSAPVPMLADLIGAAVRLEVEGDASLIGVVRNWPVTLDAEYETGRTVFRNLIQFELDSAFVRPGWSGSVIFKREGIPLALLSFGSNRTADQPAFGYGFPLATRWATWGLSTL